MSDAQRIGADIPDFDMICAEWGEDRSQYHGAVVPPIYQNSLFTYPDCETRTRSWTLPAVVGDESRDNAISPYYDYTRVSNPTTDIVEAKVAAMECADSARCFGSGMAAISAAILSCVKAGDHIVAPATVYGPTRQLLTEWLPRFGVTTTYVDGCDPADWSGACHANTALFFLESPSSVAMKQQDLTAVAAIAHERDIAAVCDNSWASPIFQNPLKLGVDLVVHSATKYLGGHSDIVAGVVAGPADRMKALTFAEGFLLGAVLDPFAAWLMLRGMRTLPVRMERHQTNARIIAERLENHEKVSRVYYPGSASDSQAELTARQLRGSSGLLSFELKRLGKAAAYQLVDGLKYFGIGCSWGGFESLALPHAIPAHALGEERGAPARWLIRLHIGLENVEELWRDISANLHTIE